MGTYKATFAHLYSAESGVEPQPKYNLLHFSLKIWQLVATMLIILLIINWLSVMINSS